MTSWNKILLPALVIALSQEAKAADFDEHWDESREAAPRLRWGVAGLFGGNSFFDGGY